MAVARTVKVEDGKYEFDRTSTGLLVGVRRNGEPWPQAFESMQFSKAFHALLNRIEQLEDEATARTGDHNGI